MTKVLITGAGSYVGESVKKYILASQEKVGRNSGEVREPEWEIDSVDTMSDAWKQTDFSKYDVVYHVAGIAHVNADPKMEPLYYKVNRDLTIEIAKHAKENGVKQFIFMSSQIVFHESKSLKTEVLTKETKPNPNGFYGDSKLQAEKGLWELAPQAPLKGDVDRCDLPPFKGDRGGCHENLYSPSLYDLWTECEGKFPSFGKVGDEGASISSVA